MADLTDYQVDAIVQIFRTGGNLALVAEFLGCGLDYARTKIRTTPGLADAIEVAREAKDGDVMQALATRATTGDPRAAQLWLTHRQGWLTERTESRTQVDASVTHTHELRGALSTLLGGDDPTSRRRATELLALREKELFDYVDMPALDEASS